MNTYRKIIVRSIGGLYVGFGAAIVLTVIIAAVYWNKIFRELESEISDILEDQRLLVSIGFLFEHMLEVLLVFGIIALLAVVAGVGMLRLKKTAAILAEGIMWAANVYSMLFCGLWVVWVTSIIPDGMASGASVLAKMAIFVFGTIVIIVSVFPGTAIILILRNKKTRALMRR